MAKNESFNPIETRPDKKVGMPKKTLGEWFFLPLGFALGVAKRAISWSFATLGSILALPVFGLIRFAVRRGDSSQSEKDALLNGIFAWKNASMFGVITKLLLPARTSYAAKTKYRKAARAFKRAIAREMKEKTTNKTSDTSIQFLRFKVQTFDFAKLDTFEVRPAGNIAQNYIIDFAGNNTCFEQNAKTLIQYAKSLHCNVIGFNYRGVGNSTDPGLFLEFQDLVNDGIAQVQRLLDTGVKPENITLKSHSLGGAIASHVAAHFHKQGIRIFLFNALSFSTTTQVVRSTTGSRIVAFFAKIVLVISGFDIDAASAYNSIPDAYKTEIVAKTPKSAKLETRFQDDVIPYSASMYMDKTVKTKRRALKEALFEYYCFKQGLNTTQKKHVKDCLQAFMEKQAALVKALKKVRKEANLVIAALKLPENRQLLSSSQKQLFLHEVETILSPEIETLFLHQGTISQDMLGKLRGRQEPVLSKAIQALDAFWKDKNDFEKEFNLPPEIIVHFENIKAMQKFNKLISQHPDAHNESLDKLHTTYGLSAEDFFYHWMRWQEKIKSNPGLSQQAIVTPKADMIYSFFENIIDEKLTPFKKFTESKITPDEALSQRGPDLASDHNPILKHYQNITTPTHRPLVAPTNKPKLST